MRTGRARLDAFAAAEAPSVGEAVRALREAFLATSGEGAQAEARRIVGHVLGLDLTGLVVKSGDAVSPQSRDRIVGLAERRLGGEPVQRVVGSAPFWGLDFALSPATLVPRPDSETLVAAVLERLDRARPGEGPMLADLGVGSGALLIALLIELPAARGIGSDLSAAALVTARANAERLGVGDRALFVRGSYADMLAPAAFDAVVSNPPYVETAEIDGLDAEVRLHEPRLALDGGADGLDAYRCLAATLPRVMRPGGLVALEIGWRQGPAVAALLAAAGFDRIEVVADLAGRDRVVVARAPGVR